MEPFRRWESRFRGHPPTQLLEKDLLAELDLLGRNRIKRNTNWEGTKVQEDIPVPTTPNSLADEMSSQ